MQIKLLTAFAVSALASAGSNAVAQTDGTNAVQQFSLRRNVATAEPTLASSEEPSATVLRASTDTGISKATIDRQVKRPTQEGVRVAAAPEIIKIAARPALDRRTAVPAPPEMSRKPFLVGFRRPAQSSQSVIAGAQPTDGVAGSVVEPAIASDSPATPEIPAVDSYTPNVPAAPETTADKAQPEGGSASPGLSVPSNASTENPDYCKRDCRNRCWCNLGPEKKLFPERCDGIELGGWLSQGYHNRETIMTNNRRREWNLHQAWLYAGKEASSDSCDWDVGFQADLLYGIDAQDLQAFGNGPTGAPSGWDNDWDFGSFGWALPQLYAEFANHDWNVKIGKFFSPFGYEVIAAPDNFFYSHTYTMFNSEPFTMSGVLAERRVSDTKSYLFGVTAGWDTAFENNEGGGNLIFGTREQLTDDISLAVTNSWGDAGTRGSGSLTSAVAEVAVTDSIDYVLQADFLNLGTNQEFGIIHYLFKEINPCLSLGARLEWWKSDQFFTSSRSTYGYTVGANYRHNANVTIRPELRFDWGAAAIDPGAPILAFDVVRTF